jgi:hypothetical protein
MARWALLLAVVFFADACATDEPHRRRRRRRHRRPQTVVIHEAPPEPRRRILRRVCAPVQSCSRFAGCALAEEQPDPEAPGQVRYMVTRYDTDPSRVDTVLEWGRLCWSEPDGRSCVDAFETGVVRCADEAALSTQAPPRCEVQAGVCGPVGGASPDAGP